MRSAALATFVLFCASFSITQQAAPSQEQDKQALMRLEREWAEARNAATLERIYGPGFIHILADGQIVTRQEELDYRRKSPENKRPPLKFEDMRVRIYGDIGIVEGRTVVTGEKGEVIRKTSFTDVFRRRDGRWEAINAQETQVDPKYWK